MEPDPATGLHRTAKSPKTSPLPTPTNSPPLAPTQPTPFIELFSDSDGGGSVTPPRNRGLPTVDLSNCQQMSATVSADFLRQAFSLPVADICLTTAAAAAPMVDELGAESRDELGVESRDLERKRQTLILYLVSHIAQLRSSGAIDQLQSILVDAQFITPDALEYARHVDFNSLDNVMSHLLGGPSSSAVVPYTCAPQQLELKRDESRYLFDFEQFRFLGHGGFGTVYQIVPITAVDSVDQIRREVFALAAIEHPNCVRYYTSWVEQGAVQLPACANRSGMSSSREFSFSTDGSSSGFSDTSNSEGVLLIDLSQNSNLSVEEYVDNMGSRRRAEPEVIWTMFIQMQLCEQRTLAHWIEDGHARGAADVLSVSIGYLHQVVQGLHHVHSCGLIHRDLKPANIFFSNNTLKIASSSSGGCAAAVVGSSSSSGALAGDFGLSVKTVSEQPTTQHGALVRSSAKAHTSGVSASYTAHTITAPLCEQVGTASYSSPEQMSSGSYTCATDVFSLGIIFFEVLYRMGTAMERADLFKKARKQQLPADFCLKYPLESELIRRMLALEPSERPTTSELLDSSALIVHRHEQVSDQAMLHQTIRDQAKAMKKLQQMVEQLTTEKEQLEAQLRTNR